MRPSSGLPVASVPSARESWLDAVRNLFPSFRVLAYASMAAAILLAGFLAMVYLRSNQATPPVTVENHPPQVVVPTLPTLNLRLSSWCAASGSEFAELCRRAELARSETAERWKQPWPQSSGNMNARL